MSPADDTLTRAVDWTRRSTSTQTSRNQRGPRTVAMEQLELVARLWVLGEGFAIEATFPLVEAKSPPEALGEFSRRTTLATYSPLFDGRQCPRKSEQIPSHGPCCPTSRLPREYLSPKLYTKEN